PAFGEVGIEQPRLKEVKHRLRPLSMTESGEQFQQVAQLPAQLPAVTNQGQEPAARLVQVLHAPVDDGGVADSGNTTLDQLLHRPLVARPDQPSGDLAHQGSVVALQRPLEAVGPEGSVVKWHYRLTGNRGSDMTPGLLTANHGRCMAH